MDYKNVKLVCSICGNDMFEELGSTYADSTDNDSCLLRCSDCGRVYTREKLIDENQALIEANIEECIENALAEFSKEWNKTLK